MTWTSSVSFMCPSTLSEVNWMMAPAHKQPYSAIIIILLLLLLFHHSLLNFTPRLPAPPPPCPRWAEQKVVSAPLGLDGSATEATRAVSARWVRPLWKSCDVGKMSAYSQNIQRFTVREFFTSSGGQRRLLHLGFWGAVVGAAASEFHTPPPPRSSSLSGVCLLDQFGGSPISSHLAVYLYVT